MTRDELYALQDKIFKLEESEQDTAPIEQREISFLRQLITLELVRESVMRT